jgi:hypothetical protein
MQVSAPRTTIEVRRELFTTEEQLALIGFWLDMAG